MSKCTTCCCVMKIDWHLAYAVLRVFLVVSLLLHTVFVYSISSKEALKGMTVNIF